MTEFQVPSLVISPEYAKEAAEANSWLLTVPPTARVGGKATYWTEMFDVVGSSYGFATSGPQNADGSYQRLAVRINFKVAAESADTTNLGRPFSATYLINYVQKDDKNSKEGKMSMMSTGRLNNFLRSVGLLGEEGGCDFKEMFFGDTPPVVGAKVYASIKHYKDKDGVQRQDISTYDDLSAGAES